MVKTQLTLLALTASCCRSPVAKQGGEVATEGRICMILPQTGNYRELDAAVGFVAGLQAVGFPTDRLDGIQLDPLNETGSAAAAVDLESMGCNVAVNLVFSENSSPRLFMSESSVPILDALSSTVGGRSVGVVPSTVDVIRAVARFAAQQGWRSVHLITDERAPDAVQYRAAFETAEMKIATGKDESEATVYIRRSTNSIVASRLSDMVIPVVILPHEDDSNGTTLYEPRLFDPADPTVKDALYYLKGPRPMSEYVALGHDGALLAAGIVEQGFAPATPEQFEKAVAKVRVRYGGKLLISGDTYPIVKVSIPEPTFMGRF